MCTRTLAHRRQSEQKALGRLLVGGERINFLAHLNVGLSESAKRNGNKVRLAESGQVVFGLAKTNEAALTKQADNSNAPSSALLLCPKLISNYEPV